ncbi:MAG: ABC transporter permease [Treponema sp.]|jgi:lipoprotein-releasing system permease protein|nr:ABC transporter permease [Treponema sp.]
MRWIGFVASRYVSKGRKNSPSSVLAVLGIATGVLALTVILAVMNGFQLGFIESILEISSYHIRIAVPEPGSEPPDRTAAIRRMREIPGIAALTPFREFHGIIQGKRQSQQVAVIRGLPQDALAQDGGMAEKLVFEAGSFDLAGARSILLGAELARRLAARLGDEITLVSVAGLLPGNDAASNEAEPGVQDAPFTVTGIFRSGFYEYDLGWGFTNIDTARELGGGSLSWGVKLKNRWQDSQVVGLIENFLETEPSVSAEAFTVSTWRDYNRAFFGALRTEKLFMFVLVGLIFIVVGLNIFQSQRRAVLERREEIGLLRALGAGEWAVRLVFVWDGFIIGLGGAGLGMLLGLLIASHIAAFFTMLEGLVNGVIAVLNSIAGLMGVQGAAEFAVFSPAVFYIKEIPSRVIPHEVVLICLFGFLSALLAAWFASGKVSRTRPAEVLRYE